MYRANTSLLVPLAILIVGRDVALSISAFYFRYISLPKPVCVRGKVISQGMCELTPRAAAYVAAVLRLLHTVGSSYSHEN